MTLQEQFNLIKEGKGTQDVFLKHAKSLFPHLIPNHFGYTDTTKILLQRGVLTENIWGIATGKKENPDWFSIFNENMNNGFYVIEKPNGYQVKYVGSKEEAQAWIEKNDPEGMVDYHIRKIDNNNDDLMKMGQQAVDMLKGATVSTMMNESEEPKIKASINKPSKEVDEYKEKSLSPAYKAETGDDVIFDQLIRGIQVEMYEEKNMDKDVEEVKSIVLKNLKKDPLYYLKNALFNVKGIGLVDEIPGLGKPKEVKGKYASSGMEPAIKGSTTPRSNVKDGKSENKKGMPSKVESMTMAPKSSKGVKKMALPGKEKKIRLQENAASSLLRRLIREELNLKEIDEIGNSAAVEAKVKKIDEEIRMRQRKLKALETLKELEDDAVNPKKVKDLQSEVKKLEDYKKKITKVKGKKKELVDETSIIDPKTDMGTASEIASQEGVSQNTVKQAIGTAKKTGEPVTVVGKK